jgi:hypothetical protein
MRDDECEGIVGKPEGERTLRRPRHKWMDNIKMDFGWDGMGWDGMGWYRPDWCDTG